MNMTSSRERAARWTRRAGLLASAGAALVGILAACSTSDLLSVDAPSRIPAGPLESAANAQLLLNGAQADFECAFGGYAVLGGLIGEELENYTQTADLFIYDQRSFQSKDARYATSSCGGAGAYTPLQASRVSANNLHRIVAAAADADVPNRSLILASASAYEAYSQLLLSEGFCSIVFSVYDAAGQIQWGTEMTRAQALAIAEATFTRAITEAQAAGTAGANVLNLAYVGRARTRLDQGNLTGARADAVLVPAGFTFLATSSAGDPSDRRTNRQFGFSGGTNSLAGVPAAYRAFNDPRVPVVDLKRNSVYGLPMFLQGKFTSQASSTRIASYDEAQLIIAEADLTANAGNATTIINTYRARGNQAPLVAPTAADLKAALIDQRRRELYLESQHLGDLIRYQITPTPASGTAFYGGGQYGSSLCLPLPDVEKQNNPLLNGSK